MIKRAAALTFVAFLLGCNPLNYTLSDHPRYASSNIVSSPVTIPNSLKIVSFNIKYSKKVDRAIELIRSHKDLKDADVILLQEMIPDRVKQMADALEYNYVYYPALLHPVVDADFGNAILSKWPIAEDQKIILPSLKTHTRQRIAVVGKLDVAGQDVYVMSLHMGIFVKPDRRKTLVDTILAPIPPKAKYCVIGGDFNSYTKKDRASINESFQEEGYSWVSENLGWTFKQGFFFNRKYKLDHIFSKGFEIVDSGKVTDHSASDHMPIWAKFRMQ